MALGKLERALYRSLLRLGRQFDRPVLKVRIRSSAAVPAGSSLLPASVPVPQKHQRFARAS